MSTNAHDNTPDHANSIFENRNRAFRVLYDTVIDVTQTTDTRTIYELLCKNLRYLCNASITAIASYDRHTQSIKLQAISTEENEITVDPTQSCNTGILSEETSAIYKHTHIRECINDEACLTMILPHSFIGTINYNDTEHKCYSLSFMHGNALLALGIITLKDNKNLKMKDMVDTFLGLGSVIIQRTNAIVELQKSNEKFQTFIDNSPMGIIVINSSRIIVEINQAALEIVNQKRDAVIGKQCTHLVCPPHNECPMIGNTKIDRQECFVIRADGASVPILKSVATIEIDNEPYFLETFIDITEQKKAEAEKNKLQQQLFLGQKLEAIGTLAAGIAHEINTPLQFIGDNTRYIESGIEKIFSVIDCYQSSIETITESAEKKAISSTLAKLYESIDLDYLKKDIPNAIKETLEGISHASKIVKAMHAFSFVGDTRKSIADINKSIMNIIMISRNSWKKFANIATDFDPHLPLVTCYISEINQVIMNIIINATHAIKDRIHDTNEKGTIVINTKTVDDYVSISIKDNGAGIPISIQPRIFEPFFTTKEVGQGTGQGLSISYATIVEKHKGKLFFESEVNVGTTFYIHIPIE